MVDVLVCKEWWKKRVVRRIDNSFLTRDFSEDQRDVWKEDF